MVFSRGVGHDWDVVNPQERFQRELNGMKTQNVDWSPQRFV